MGLFSNMFSGAKELNRLANGVSSVKQILDQYEIDPDVTWILVAAWLCKAGVLDVIERNKWPSNYILYVEINGHQTKMTVGEALMHTVTRLHNKVSSLNDTNFESQIDDILDGGPSFDELDKQIPDNIRIAIQ